MPRAKTAQDYHALARERGLAWLGVEPPGTQRPTAWRCAVAGHVFERTFNALTALKGCPLCSGRVRKTPDDYHALAATRGWTWLGPEAQTASDLTRWRCDRGHVVESRYTSVQQGSGCPQCSGRAAKTYEDFHALAEGQGLLWLGARAVSTRAKTTWRCVQGHAFAATFNAVQQGHGCPTCAGNAPPTAAEFEQAARAAGLTWLGPSGASRRARSRWRCRRGHVWETSLMTVARGLGCPACRSPRHTADAYAALATRRGLIWVGPLPRTVEGKTAWRCAEGHVFKTRYALIQRGTGCPVCAGHAIKSDTDYRALARRRRLTWLGPSVPQTNRKTQWLCGQGHRFRATYASVRSGHGCPRCAGNARKTIADYRALARRRKIRWVGRTLPANVGTKTLWECSLGHRWAQRYNVIQQGSGCPECAGRRARPFAESASPVRARARRGPGDRTP